MLFPAQCDCNFGELQLELSLLSPFPTPSWAPGMAVDYWIAVTCWDPFRGSGHFVPSAIIVFSYWEKGLSYLRFITIL